METELLFPDASCVRKFHGEEKLLIRSMIGMQPILFSVSCLLFF